MSCTIRMACIGCGFIGRRHLQNLVCMEGVSLEAVADQCSESAELFRNEFGARYATTEVDRLFDDRNVDAVLICTYHDSHTVLACKAASSGKHILLEKPMALTAGECRRIAAAAESAGVKLSINFKFRFAPAVLKAKEIVSHPMVTSGQLSMEAMPDDIWVRDPARGGGLVLATACHTLDMVHFLNDSEPVRVYAESHPSTPEGGCNVRAAVATLRFANGAVASLLLADAGENAHVGKWLHQIFDGKRSAVLYDHFRQVRFSGAHIPHFAAGDDLHADGTYGVLHDFVQCIRADRQPAISGRDGLRATLLGIKILQSLRSGKPEEVRLDELD